MTSRGSIVDIIALGVHGHSLREEFSDNVGMIIFACPHEGTVSILKPMRGDDDEDMTVPERAILAPLVRS
jgi:hypothetical protein